jgi:hypothetical protein
MAFSFRTISAAISSHIGIIAVLSPKPPLNKCLLNQASRFRQQFGQIA